MEKYSKQREEVLNFLKKSYSHPTAEDIYIGLKKINSTASIGTVYRNLERLSQKGIIKQISTENGPCRYDYMNDTHHHIVCKKCGKVYDFNYQINIEDLKSTIKNNTKAEMIGQDITVQGICKSCKEL